MADLTGTTPADTYKGLLQVNDYTNGVDATAKYIQDGEGTDSALAISTGNVGIGTSSPSAPLHIVDTGTADMIFLESTDDGDLNSPDFNLYRNSASPAADDKIGLLKFSGNSSGGVATGYAHIEGTIVNPTNLKSKLAFKIRSDGALESRMEVGPDKVEVSSTTGGVVMPRVTTTQRTAIPSPTDGEMVYDTDLNKFYGYANGAWTALH